MIRAIPLGRHRYPRSDRGPRPNATCLARPTAHCHCDQAPFANVREPILARRCRDIQADREDRGAAAKTAAGGSVPAPTRCPQRSINRAACKSRGWRGRDQGTVGGKTVCEWRPPGFSLRSPLIVTKSRDAIARADGSAAGRERGGDVPGGGGGGIVVSLGVTSEQISGTREGAWSMTSASWRGWARCEPLAVAVAG